MSAPSPYAASLLAQFPRPVFLRASPVPAFFYLFLGVSHAGVGLWALLSSDGKVGLVVFGLIMIAIFGPVIPVALLMMRPHNGLRLEREQLVAVGWRHSVSYSWSDVQNVRVENHPDAPRSVVFDRSGHPPGNSYAFDVTTVEGLRPKDQAYLLNVWRHWAVTTAHSSTDMRPVA